MKKIKIFIFILVSMVFLTLANVKLQASYTYDHKGQPIYSTDGLTVNQDPFVASSLGIDPKLFTAPEDLFLYTDKEGQETIYIVDSVSNNLFVLDSTLKLKETINSFKVPVKNFTIEQLSKIKSDKNWVMARNTHFLQTTKSKPINYTEVDIDVAEIKLSTKNAEVAVIEFISGQAYVTAVGAGQTTVTFEFFTELDLEKETPTASRSQTYTIVVTDEVPGTVIDPLKNSGFSPEEIANMDSFNLKLSGVVCVYRAVIENTGDDYLYLCDRGNNQIVVVDALTYEAVKFVTVPNDVSFEGVTFSPKDIVTDSTGRMYVIADNVFEGIIQFSKEGVFNRFTGVNYVTLSAWEIFWRNISTEAQLQKQKSIINTSFTSMYTKNDGFIYTTSYATTDDSGVVTNDNEMIKRINTSGSDVLRRNGYKAPKGDIVYIRSSTSSSVRGPSKLTSITVNNYGIYTVIDSKMGKLFTYDFEGNLLYISGAPSYIASDKISQINALSNPVAITYHGEDIYVLDKNNKAIIVFELTELGLLINEAVKYEYEGDVDNAALVWGKVVEQHSNYERAYIGIGKMYLKNKDYAQAMASFKMGEDRASYSRAFKLSRDAAIKRSFPYIAGTIIAIVVLKIAYNLFKYKRFRKKAPEEREETYD